MKYALKEWAVITEALGNGEVIAIWRKGGIADNPSVNEIDEEFNVEQTKIVLFPTYTHQSTDKVKKEYWTTLSQNSKTNKDKQIQIKYWAEIIDSVEIDNFDQLLAISKDLVNSEDQLRSSFEYNEGHKGKILFLRVYALSDTILIYDSNEYGGCKSWITLKVDIPKIRSKPILSYKDFNHKLKNIKSLINKFAPKELVSN